MKIKTLVTIALILAYILAIIIIIQILRVFFGGTWSIEDVILALVIFNLTITFGIVAKMSDIDKKLHGHIEWHKGKEQKRK